MKIFAKGKYPSFVRLLLALIVVWGLVATMTSPVWAQELTISPESGSAGMWVTVVASGFAPRATLIVDFDSVAVTTKPSLVTTDDNGNATFMMLIPPAGGGVHLVTATDGINTCNDSFVFSSGVSLSPNSGPVGTRITIWAKGATSHVLDVRFDGITVVTNPAVVLTDMNGNAKFVLVIPSTATIGSHEITIDDGVSPYNYTLGFEVTGGLLGLASSPWPMFHHDAQHTGRSPASGPSSPTLGWTYPTGGSILSSPSLDTDGTVYVGSTDGKLYAILAYGNTKWIYSTGDKIVSSPAIGRDGTIYVGSQDGNLYAIDLTGSLKWSYTAGGIASSPAMAADGTIYVGSLDNVLYAIKPDGSSAWSYTTGGPVVSSPAIGADGTIYVGSYDNKLYAIKPDGSSAWSYTTGGPVVSSPAVGADGTIYAGSNDNKLYAIKPDGSSAWSYTTGGPVVSSPAIGADGTIYVGSNDNKLYAIKPDGSSAWSYTTGGLVVSSPAIGADGTVYVNSMGYSPEFYSINHDGSLKWSFALNSENSIYTGSIVSSPAVTGHAIYIGLDDGKLYSIINDHQPQTTSTPSPTPYTIPALTAERQAFFPYIIAIALGALVTIGASSGYIWRKRRETLMIERFKQKLGQWEQDGYDVSAFKNKWFG